VALRRPAAGEELSATIEGGAVRALWALPAMRDMCGLVFVGFGVFVAIATWLQTLLEPAGVSEGTAGALLAGMILAGIAGCALLPAPVDRHRAERRFLRLALLVSICGCTALGAISALGARAGVLAAMGFILLPALPIVLTVTERLAGPAAGTAGALVWMAGNLGGLVVALMVQALVHHPSTAFLSMAAISLLGLPLAMRLQTAPEELLLKRHPA
jgi:cyanate permease